MPMTVNDARLPAAVAKGPAFTGYATVMHTKAGLEFILVAPEMDALCAAWAVAGGRDLDESKVVRVAVFKHFSSADATGSAS